MLCLVPRHFLKQRMKHEVTIVLQCKERRNQLCFVYDADHLGSRTWRLRISFREETHSWGEAREIGPAPVQAWKLGVLFAETASGQTSLTTHVKNENDFPSRPTTFPQGHVTDLADQFWRVCTWLRPVSLSFVAHGVGRVALAEWQIIRTIRIKESHEQQSRS